MINLSNEKILTDIAKNLEKISNSILLNSLMEYRKKHENIMIQVLKSDAKKAIYELCNGENKVTDIAKILNKKQPTISLQLKDLFDEKIVFNNQTGAGNFPISIDAIIENIITSNLK